MIHPNASDTLTVRSVFVIDGDKKVRLTLTYRASTGRNFDELLRSIDSLRLASQHQAAKQSPSAKTPAKQLNWLPCGKIFPEHFHTFLYTQVTP